MNEYSTRKALIDLGFINGYFYSRPSNIADDIWFEGLTETFRRIEETCIKGTLLEADPAEKDYRQMLHDLGFIRGWAWQKKIPDAVSDAITRVIDYFSAALPVTDIVFAAPKPIERPEDMVSLDTRHEVTTHYGLFPNIDGVSSCNGVENHVTERIVASIRDEEAEARLEIEIHGVEEPDEQPIFQETSLPPASSNESPRACLPQSRDETTRGGRPPKIADTDLPMIDKMIELGASLDDIATRFDCGYSTVEKYLKRHARVTGPRPLIIEPETEDQPSAASAVQPVNFKNEKPSDETQVAEPSKVSLAKPAPLSEPPSPHRLSISHPDWAGKREDSQLHASDWPDIQEMLAKGRSRMAIAGDYDVPVEHLDDFIADRLKEAQERRAAKETAPGEA